jgi:hypothetical protein
MVASLAIAIGAALIALWIFASAFGFSDVGDTVTSPHPARLKARSTRITCRYLITLLLSLALAPSSVRDGRGERHHPIV